MTMEEAADDLLVLLLVGGGQGYSGALFHGTPSFEGTRNLRQHPRHLLQLWHRLCLGGQRWLQPRGAEGPSYRAFICVTGLQNRSQKPLQLWFGLQLSRGFGGA